jgi:hypothetical protein
MNAKRPMVAAALLVVCIAAAYVFATWPPPYPQEIIKDSAIAMIDRAQLTPEMDAFLAAAEDNHTNGRKITEFSGLLRQMFPDADSSPYHGWTVYHVHMPMDEQHQTEFEKTLSEDLGVPCWPVLSVRVENETQIILQTIVFTQCL